MSTLLPEAHRATVPSAWEDLYTNPPTGWTAEPPVLTYAGNKSDRDTIRRAYENNGGCSQRVRSKNPLQSGYYDVIHYTRWIKKLLSLVGTNPLVADVGCGNGRIVDLLLAQSVRRIIAQDFNPADLAELIAYLPEDSAMASCPSAHR